MLYGKFRNGKIKLREYFYGMAPNSYKPVVPFGKPDDGCQYEKVYAEKEDCIEQTWQKTEMQLRLEASEEAILELAEVIGNG